MKGHITSKVKTVARGRWKEIYLALAPQLKPAIERAGKHVRCPVHGGEDGFRLFPRYEEDGSGICNTCGAKTDGFSMLMWLNGWSFRQAVNAVGNYLFGVPEQRKGIRTVAINSQKEFRGQLLAFNQAPYKFNASNMQSYFVRISTVAQRMMTFWGTDLERAVEVAGVKVGDWISLSRIAKEQHLNNQSFADRNVWLIRKELSPAEQKLAQHDKAKQDAQEAAKKEQLIEKVWRESQPIQLNEPEAQPICKYLESRSIMPRDGWGGETLRFHPSQPYYDSADHYAGKFPCLVAAVRDNNGRLITLHRTYLTTQGRKAAVEAPKKLMAVPNGLSINGAAVQLCKVQKTLAVAEGIETALSVMKLYRVPCWSVLSANGMTHFEVPKGVQELRIYADKDKSGTGLAAAKALAERVASQGIKVQIFEPEGDIEKTKKSLDFNDVLLRQAR